MTSGTGSTMVLGLPDAGLAGHTADSGTSVSYRDADSSYDLAVQTTARGARALLTLRSAAAPRRYAFPLSLPAGVRPALASDGSVSLLDTQGSSAGGFARPWAHDALGRPVQTTFTLEGNTLVQHVVVTADTAFPVVADPDGWWGWVKCTASIGALVAGNLLIAAKITKLGGVAKVIKVLKAARNAEERYKALLYFFGEFTGIGAVITNCR